MQIPKPSDADKDYFRSIVPNDPAIEVKPLFGNLGVFVNGNMFAALFGSVVGVRVADADRTTLEAIEGSGPFGPAERPMGGYTGLPEAWRDDAEQATSWIAKAHEYVAAMPAKVSKSRRPKK